MAQLTIENLCKKFDSMECLTNVNLTINDGEFVVILGPSGCGKTTLLRCIAGLETCDTGSIFIDNELITDKEPKDRNVAMVFQYYALYPHMTVRQNMSLGLEYTTDLSRIEIRKRVEQTANLLKISNLLDRRPAQLSGGESQRVAIGRALVREPKVFLLDEPLSAVDAKLRRELRTEIKRIQRSLGVTTLYVTHDQEEAMAIADRIVVLAGGHIQQVGSPEEIYNHPKNKFIAGFIGKPAMNFINAEIETINHRHILQNGGFLYEISEEFYVNYLSNYTEKNLIIGIRPSAIKITSHPAKNAISAKVSLLENVGNENNIYLSLDSIRLIAKTSLEETPKIGDKLNISFEEDDLYLFDSKSENSLRI